MSKKRKKRGQRRPPPPQKSAAREQATASRGAAAKRAAARGRAAAEDERPPAPWGSFPLVELVTLVALVLLVVGFFVVKGTQGGVMVGVGVVLGSLAGLELVIREHFGGYRSHSLLLGGVAATAVLAGLFYLAPESFPVPARLAIGVAVFVGAAWGLSLAFQRRAGVAYKLR
jgi:hypothetical protein